MTYPHTTTISNNAAVGYTEERPGPQRRPVIDATDGLARLASHLEDLVASLTERLEPVLRIAPTEQGRALGEPAMDCALANTLEALGARYGDIADKVERLIGRVAL